MAIHRELAALVRQAGRGVLLDASEFRAAFDDFVPEGSASEGDVNLLTDAVRLGALGRVVDQIGQGADPALAIETQGVRLAQQRGTCEATGAQWALAVLVFARGDLDEQPLLTRFRAPTDSLPRPGFLPPTVPPPLLPPTVVPLPAATEAPASPTPTAPPAVPDPAPAPRTAHAAPPRPDPIPAAPKSKRRPLRWVAAASVLGVLGAGTFVVLNAGDDEPKDKPPAADRTDPGLPTIATGTFVATTEVTPPPLARPAVMAGRVGGVTLTGLDEPQQVGSGDGARVAGQGDRLVAFTLAQGPCQIKDCRGWQTIGLKVQIGGESVPLPAGGPTFLLAAPNDVSVHLQYDADGYDQQLNLADGTDLGENIQVLTRKTRTIDVRGKKPLRPSTEDTRVNLPADLVWSVRVGKADLFFFDGKVGPKRPDRAYLRFDVYYVEPDGDEFEFFDGELHLFGPDDVELPRRNLGTPAETDPVFVVPADFTTGTLVVSGVRDDVAVGSQGSRIPYQLNLPRTAFDVTFPD